MFNPCCCGCQIYLDLFAPVGGVPALADNWDTVAGNWSTAGGILRADAAGSILIAKKQLRTTTGVLLLQPHTATPPPSNQIRLLADYVDAANYLAAEIEVTDTADPYEVGGTMGHLRLIRRAAGVETILASAFVPADKDREILMLAVYPNGRAVATLVENTAGAGQPYYGVWANATITSKQVGIATGATFTPFNAAHAFRMAAIGDVSWNSSAANFDNSNDLYYSAAGETPPRCLLADWWNGHCQNEPPDQVTVTIANLHDTGVPGFPACAQCPTLNQTYVLDLLPHMLQPTRITGLGFELIRYGITIPAVCGFTRLEVWRQRSTGYIRVLLGDNANFTNAIVFRGAYSPAPCRGTVTTSVNTYIGNPPCQVAGQIPTALIDFGA